MQLEVTRLEGRRNDLRLRLERSEIEEAVLSLPHRTRLAALPGMPRHRTARAAEEQGIAESKVPIDEHLRGLGIIDAGGRAVRRAVAISNRNLGTNQGHVAWQRAESPRAFHILEDPLSYASYSCLAIWVDGHLCDRGSVVRLQG